MSDMFETAARRARTGDLSVAELIGTADGLPGVLARALYRDWITHNAAHPMRYAVLFNYGVCAGAAGELQEAASAYDAAIVANPAFLAARINLGSVQERLGARDVALARWYEVVQAPSALNADTLAWKVAAWKQIGRVLEAARCEQPAEDALCQGLSLDPHQPDAIQHWIALRQAQCRWPVIEPFAGLTRGMLMRSMSPLSLAAYADDPVLQLANAHRSYLQEAPHAGACTVGVWPAPDTPRQRLRIGYLSSDLREHAVGFLTCGMFAHHDRSRAEIFAYYTGPDSTDATQARIRGTVDHWRQVSTLTDTQAAAMIVADGIDILVDLNGYTRDARTRLLALRPAPVIVNWLGYPGSMGTPHHHYIIADRHVIPPQDERYYSERVVRLPCYQPNDRLRVVEAATPTRADCGLPDDATVYCCFNGANKITAPVFARWMRILEAVDGSVLWLLATNAATNARLRDQAALAGIDPARLVFAGRLPTPEHLARYRLADLFLDTSPYGAHTTASDALWMGVPVLTFTGRGFAARVCASLVHAAGLSELVAETPDGYERAAVALGRDPARLRALSARLADTRASCTLFDTAKLVRHLEALFAQMWAAHCRGATPVPQLGNLPLYHEIGCDRTDDRTDPAAWYRACLAYRHAVSPVPADALLWQAADADSQPAALLAA